MNNGAIELITEYSEYVGDQDEIKDFAQKLQGAYDADPSVRFANITYTGETGDPEPRQFKGHLWAIVERKIYTPSDSEVLTDTP
jgi:hypothetical protein